MYSVESKNSSSRQTLTEVLNDILGHSNNHLGALFRMSEVLHFAEGQLVVLWLLISFCPAEFVAN